MVFCQVIFSITKGRAKSIVLTSSLSPGGGAYSGHADWGSTAMIITLEAVAQS